MNVKLKKILLIAAPLVVGGTILYLLNKPKKKKLDPAKDDSLRGTDASSKQTGTTYVTNSPSSSYPLKNGSNNDLVKQLQTALISAYGSSILPKYGADGDWGTETDKAMQSKFGVTSIGSQAEFNNIISKLKAIIDAPAKAAAAATDKSRADMITSNFNLNSSYQLMAIRNTTAYGFVKSFDGSLNPTGKNLNLKANNKLSRADYVPNGSTTSGFLMFTVGSGDLAGTYKVDPNDMTLVTGNGTTFSWASVFGL